MNDAIERQLDDIAARWSSLGTGFNIPPSGETPDLECLLLDTARYMPFMPRLLPMAATWLHTHADAVARKRLERLIDTELEPEHHATLGLLLSASQEGRKRDAFATLTAKKLKPATDPASLFEIDRSRKSLSRLAESSASKLSRHWGRWCEPFRLKQDALRPATWIFARHEEIELRTMFKGDLRASIIAALLHDKGAGQSQRRLAKFTGGSRAQVLEQLDHLAMLGLLELAPEYESTTADGPLPPRAVSIRPLQNNPA